MENQSIIDYSIDNLTRIFATHARITNNMHQEQIARFKEANPDAPIPDHMKDPFNISLALSVMAQEINNLRSKS